MRKHDLKEERRIIQADLYAGVSPSDEIQQKSARVREIDVELRKQDGA